MSIHPSRANAIVSLAQSFIEFAKAMEDDSTRPAHGIEVSVTGSELATLMVKRADAADNEATGAETRLAAATETYERSQLATSASRLRAESTRLRFTSTHLSNDRIYRLSSSDLSTLFGGRDY